MYSSLKIKERIMYLILIILTITLALFIWGKFTPDIVAIIFNIYTIFDTYYLAVLN